MDMSNDWSGGMGLGHGVFGILFWALVILSILALLKWSMPNSECHGNRVR